jgi:hypothetical protein
MSGPDQCFEADEGPDVVREYFLKRGVKYIAYSFINEAGFQKEFFKKHQAVKNRGWQESTRRVYALQNQLEKMMGLYAHAYKDNAFVILDLTRPLATTKPSVLKPNKRQIVPPSP